jgi:prevent-host-death family protein
MEAVSIETARRTLGEIVDKARLAGQPTLVTRQGKRAAVVVSADWYERAKAAIEGEDGEELAARYGEES